MDALTIGQVLDRVTLFEAQLQDTYTTVRDQCVDHGARLLSYYLSRHRRQVARSCNDVNRRKFDRISAIELPREICFAPTDIEPLLTMSPQDITGNQLLATAVAYHTHLRELCQSILRQRLHPEAVALFEELEDLQEQEIETLEKMQTIEYFESTCGA